MIRIIKESIEDDFDDMFDFGDENAEWYDSIYISKECIKGATLLSKEEYEKYKDNIPKVNQIWWLRSPGFCSFSASQIDNYGDIYYSSTVDCDFVGIRPSLILNLQNINLDTVTKFKFGGYDFTIISNDLAICDNIIGRGCFRKNHELPNANDYKKSDVKKVVDDWFNKAYAEYEG